MNEPVWSRRPREASDRFADAVDRAGRAPETGDTEFADELAVVALLRQLGSEPVLEPARRDRMKAAVMSEAAAITTDDEPEESATVRPLARPSRAQRRKAGLWAAATAAGIVALGAFGIELSQSALPGEWLYDVKRTTESISLDLTFSPSGKALRQLELAETRIAELAALAERDRADGGTTAEELAGYRSLIADLNGTVAAASRNITSYAPQTNGDDLRALRDWAKKNRARLAALRPDVPASTVGDLDGSVELISRVQQRASALLARWPCRQITSGHADALGALPATLECQDAPTSPDLSVRPRASEQPADSTRGKSPSAAKPGDAPSTAEDPAEQKSPDNGGQPGGSGSDSAPPTVQLPEAPDRTTTQPPPDEPTQQPGGLPLLPLLEKLGKLNLRLDLN
ncbi:DUF5667 domain-containing protein [Thermocrispum sp.]|uniref:DUF5667 domain-containing protein n=1 Tax=Thermocrispum sp. TaxID=2060768 RepID=UPI00257B5F7A|nr:DUF5667 domain-containing protein [Thermocrispum sp.]